MELGIAFSASDSFLHNHDVYQAEALNDMTGEFPSYLILSSNKSRHKWHAESEILDESVPVRKSMNGLDKVQTKPHRGC